MKQMGGQDFFKKAKRNTMGKGETKEIMRWGITCATLLVKSGDYTFNIIA